MKQHYSDPAESPESRHGLTRQSFIQLALGGVGMCYAAAIGYPIYRYLASPMERVQRVPDVTAVTLKEALQLAPGSALAFKFDSKPALLIHHSDDTWAAMTAVCTHMGCTVRFEASKNRVFCPCHGGAFDPRTGANVSGPPPKPLNRFQVKITSEGAVVSRA